MEIDPNVKLKSLKQALLQEKENRKDRLKTIENLKSQIAELEDQSKTLESIIERKIKEKETCDEELENQKDQLKLAKAKSNPVKKSFGSSKNIIALQAQNEKLMEEYSNLKSDHKQDEVYITQIKETYSHQTKSIRSIEVEIIEIHENSSLKQESFLNLKTRILEEIEEIAQQKKRLADRNAEISEELDKHLRRNLRLRENLDHLSQFILTKSEIEKALAESVSQHEKNERNLANLLFEAKAELLDAHTFYQEFQVKLVKLMIPVSAKLVLRKTQDDKYVIELLYKNKQELIEVKDLDDVSEHLNKENRFFIKFHNKSKEILTEEVKKIVPRIRELMERCVN